MPVRWAALVRSIFVVGVPTVPDVNHKTAMMAGRAPSCSPPSGTRLKLRGAIDRGEAGTPAQRTAPAEPVAPSDPATTVPEQA